MVLWVDMLQLLDTEVVERESQLHLLQHLRNQIVLRIVQRKHPLMVSLKVWIVWY
jgi:hypothetical protein